MRMSMAGMKTKLIWKLNKFKGTAQHAMFCAPFQSFLQPLTTCNDSVLFPSFPQTMTIYNVLCFHHFNKQRLHTMFSISIIPTNNDNLQCSLLIFHHFHKHWKHTIFSVLFPSFPQPLTTYNILCSVSIISTTNDNIQYSLFCFHHFHKQWQHTMFSVLFPSFPQTLTTYNILCSVSIIITNSDNIESFFLFCFHFSKTIERT